MVDTRNIGRALAAAGVALLLLTGAGCGGSKDTETAEVPKPLPPLPSDLIAEDKAESVVRDLVDADEDKDSLIAYLYPEVLRPGDEVASWGYDAEKGSEKISIDQYSYLAWIDREPGNIFYSHDTEFVIIDAKTGEAERTSEGYWPTVNGEPFEGDSDTVIVGSETSARAGENALFGVASYIKGLSVPAAAAAEDKRPRIAKDPDDAPPGEYYALIVSGYGRNAWVFLDGAWQMYDALKAAGYDDGHITFLAPGPVKPDADWDRRGEPKVTRQTGQIDGYAGPDQVTAAIAAITSKMTEKDSLFVFVIAHGEKNWFTLGRPMSNPEKVSLVRAFKGNGASLQSKKFSEALLAKTKACEIMVTIDSCHSGSHSTSLEAAYDPKTVKRFDAAFSTDASTKSLGADYRDPVDLKKKAVADLDLGKTKKTPTPDPNPADLGGEFSSGFIASLGKQVFASIYSAGVALDAAKLNKMTKPSILALGEQSGPCVVVAETTPTPPQDEAPPATAPEKIQVIPYDGSYITLEQVKQYSAAECPCCDAAHWHAKSGTVTLLDGRKVTDPYKSCGLGKVSDHPATWVDKP
jgi:hypothetical protein